MKWCQFVCEINISILISSFLKFDLNIHTDLQEAEWLILSTKKDKVKTKVQNNSCQFMYPYIMEWGEITLSLVYFFRFKFENIIQSICSMLHFFILLVAQMKILKDPPTDQNRPENALYPTYLFMAHGTNRIAHDMFRIRLSHIHTKLTLYTKLNHSRRIQQTFSQLHSNKLWHSNHCTQLSWENQDKSKTTKQHLFDKPYNLRPS